MASPIRRAFSSAYRSSQPVIPGRSSSGRPYGFMTAWCALYSVHSVPSPGRGPPDPVCGATMIRAAGS